MAKTIKYRGYLIERAHFLPSLSWEYFPNDYDGPDDMRPHGISKSVGEAQAEIDFIVEESEVEAVEVGN